MIGKTIHGKAGLPTHERLPDLLAVSDDPHPRKTRRIKFVGDTYVPGDDELLMAKVLLSEAMVSRGEHGAPLTAKIIQAIRVANKKALKPIPYMIIRVLEHDHPYALAPNPKLSRTYEWREENDFTCDVDFRDVDAILGSASGYQFRDITDKDPDEPTVIQPSPEVWKLVALEAVPSMSAKGVGPQHGDVVAAH